MHESLMWFGNCWAETGLSHIRYMCPIALLIYKINSSAVITHKSTNHQYYIKPLLSSADVLEVQLSRFTSPLILVLATESPTSTCPVKKYEAGEQNIVSPCKI